MGLVSGRAYHFHSRWAQKWARTIVTEQKNKPVLDEQSFEKLLEAAYVLQEHNRKLRELEESLESQSEELRERDLANQAMPQRSRAESEERASADYTLTLAEIVEAQHQIQMRHLELDKAMAVVAERVARITRASGAGIGILDGATVRYRAGAGSPALPVGTEVPLQTAICQANVRTGQVIRTKDVDTEFLFDPEPCRRRGIRSLVAVPIHHDGNIVGALELYFDRIEGFAEQDIHTCQLMAGLVTEALGRDAGLTLSKSMAAERSTMLAALERLQPNLSALAEDSASALPANSTAVSAAGGAKSPCWKCGSNLMTEEQFCGKCGAPRAGASEESSMQSKLASAWHMQQANRKSFTTPPGNGTSPLKNSSRRSATAQRPGGKGNLDESAGDDFPESFSLPQLGQSATQSSRSLAASEHEDALEDSLLSGSELEGENVAAASRGLTPQRGNIVWSSAAKAQDFLESLSATRTPGALARFWQSRRGDFYLALAVILVVVVVGWGIRSNHSGSAGSRTAVSRSARRAKRPAPDAELSTFDKFLIALGLAEPPETPEYKGNPDTQVWVDLSTAQYYCPGSDLYEKTAKGKLSSQRDAQLDQFEPAYRKACD